MQTNNKNEQTQGTAIVDKAIVFATQAHSGQVRKGNKAPYILHPLEAAAICATITGDQEVIAAAVLHDVAEDAGVTHAQLVDEFGERVANIVAGESEDKRQGQSAAATWKERKAEAIEHLSHGSWEELAVCLCDKLSNMRSFRREIDEFGDELWGRFNQKDPCEHAWYYRSLAEATKGHFEDTPAWQEYHRLTEEVFARYD